MMASDPPIKRLITDPKIVFDAMIPVCWSVAGYGDFLQRAFAGRAIIPGRVYKEIDGLSRAAVRQRAVEMIRPTPFAETVEVPPEERGSVLDRMIGWTSPQEVAENPNKNRGEAEAIQVSLDLGRAPFVTHDKLAILSAQTEGIAVYTSIHILYTLVIRGYLKDCLAAWAVYMSFGEAGHCFAVEDYPYGPVGQRKFLGIAEQIEAIAAKRRAGR